MYLGIYSFMIRCFLVTNVDLNVGTGLVMMIRFSKLPVFGLHIWLPKVHVEASMLRSIVLARVVLKARSVFCCWYCSEILILILGGFMGV